MSLYCGIDLHSSNHFLVVLNQELEPIVEGRGRNDLERVLARLEPHREELEGVAVESTYNRYWLVDGLMDAGYSLHLVNTSAVKRYEGLKYADDRHDARWLARLLALGILPEAGPLMCGTLPPGVTVASRLGVHACAPAKDA